MKKINKYLEDKFSLFHEHDLNDVGINLDGSTSNQVIFYRLNLNGDDLLRKRIGSGDPGVVVLNKTPSFLKLNNRVGEYKGVKFVVLEDESFERNQTILLDKLFPIKKSSLYRGNRNKWKNLSLLFWNAVSVQIRLKGNLYWYNWSALFSWRTFFGASHNNPK